MLFSERFSRYTDGTHVAPQSFMNMRNIYFSFAALLLVVLSAAACSDTPATPSSPSASTGYMALTSENIAGSWTLTTLQPSGSGVQAVPAGATYTISIADGRLSTRADCNVCNGAATLSTQTVTVGSALACTRAACATMAFETAYLAILTGENTVAVTGTSLALSSPRGRLTFVR